MHPFWSQLRIVALNELTDAFCSRRAIILMVLYLVASIGVCALFVKTLHAVDRQVVKTVEVIW